MKSRFAVAIENTKASLCTRTRV